MTNVVQHQTAIWVELKQWCDKEQASAAQARACWPEIAARMARLRRDFKSNSMFGAALEDHGIEYNAHDRAAFIWMGQYPADVLRDLMARFPSSSPQWFRHEAEKWAPVAQWVYEDPSLLDGLSCSVEQEAPSSPPSPPAEAPVVPETPEFATVEISEQRETQQVDQKPAPLNRRMVLVKKLREKTKLSDADVRGMVDHYTNSITRQMLSKLHEGVLTALAEIIRTGRLGAKNDSNMNKFSARALVPELPKEWTRDRTVEPTETKAVKAIMADAERFIAMRDAGCRTKAKCDRWWADNVTRRKAIDVTTATTPQANGSADTAPIIVHGRTIWPRPSYVSDADKYTRSAAVAMFHLWHDLDQELSRAEPSPVGRGRFILKIAMWIKQGISPHAGTMLQEMATAMQIDEQRLLETSHLAFITGDQL